MTSADRERDFAEYEAARSRLLCTTAYLPCGGRHRAEDHTRTALMKLHLAWRRIDRRESVDAYARKVLVRTVLDEHRRPWRREHTTAELLRIVHPVTWRPPAPERGTTLEALDSDGRRLDRMSYGRDPVPARCFVTPTGKVVYDDRAADDRTRCSSALAWP